MSVQKLRIIMVHVILHSQPHILCTKSLLCTKRVDKGPTSLHVDKGDNSFVEDASIVCLGMKLFSS